MGHGTLRLSQDTASRSTALHAAAKAGNVATTRAILKSSLNCCAKNVTGACVMLVFVAVTVWIE